MKSSFWTVMKKFRALANWRKRLRQVVRLKGKARASM